jgi:hypothetical protein
MSGSFSRPEACEGANPNLSGILAAGLKLRPIWALIKVTTSFPIFGTRQALGLSMTGV